MLSVLCYNCFLCPKRPKNQLLQISDILRYVLKTNQPFDGCINLVQVNSKKLAAKGPIYTLLSYNFTVVLKFTTDYNRTQNLVCGSLIKLINEGI